MGVRAPIRQVTDDRTHHHHRNAIADLSDIAVEKTQMYFANRVGREVVRHVSCDGPEHHDRYAGQHTALVFEQLLQQGPAWQPLRLFEYRRFIDRAPDVPADRTDQQAEGKSKPPRSSEYLLLCEEGRQRESDESGYQRAAAL